MRADSIRWAWGSKLSPTQKLVLLSLAHTSDKLNRSSSSLSSIQEMTGLQRRTVWKTLSELESVGAISIAREAGGGNHYTLSLSGSVARCKNAPSPKVEATRCKNAPSTRVENAPSARVENAPSPTGDLFNVFNEITESPQPNSGIQSSENNSSSDGVYIYSYIPTVHGVPRQLGVPTQGSNSENVIPMNQEKNTPKKRASKSVARGVATPIPDDFCITPEIEKWARQNGFKNLDEHLDYFIDWAKGGGKRYIDWSATFRNAVRGNWAKIVSRASSPYELGRQLAL